MDYKLVPEYFANLDNIVKSATTPQSGWEALVSYCKTCIISDALNEIAKLDMVVATDTVSKQLSEILAESPIPSDIVFLYFGLFEMGFEDSDETHAGYYISGGLNFDSENPDTLCDLPYFPENRYIRSSLLDAIKSIGATEEENFDFIDYLVMLGASALITKFALATQAIIYKTVVGFDDGDYLELN